MLFLEKNLPILKGSEAQVLWANNIRKEIIENIREILTGKTLSYRIKEVKVEDKCLSKMEEALNAFDESKYWIEIYTALKKTKEDKFFPAYYDAIVNKVLKEIKEENKSVCQVSADAYVCARRFKRKDKTVGAYAVTIVIGEEEESFSKLFTNDEGIVDMKIAAMQEVFKLCGKKQINQLNLHYDYYKIEKWCIGKYRCEDKDAQDMKMLYDRFTENNTVNFIKVDEQNQDEIYQKTTKLVYKAKNDEK